MITTLFFDAVGTLFGVRGSVGQIYSEAAKPFGIELEPDPLNQAFYDVFQSTPSMTLKDTDPEQRPRLEQQWWRGIVAQTFSRVGQDPEQFLEFDNYFNQVFDLFATQDPWFIYEETIEVLQTLTVQGIPMSIISNFDSRLPGVLQALELAHYFQSITISTEVGAAKPDPAIFQSALAFYDNLAPSSALHVGDSRSQDYAGAQKAGLQGLWLDRDAIGTDRIPPEHRILTLRELFKWVG